jgi:hypothetical protein
MKIAAFLWDERNVGHIATHGVSPEEAEQVFWKITGVRRARSGRYVAIGLTEAGRYLFIVFGYFGNGVVRVITARDATSKERRSYGKK